MAKKTLEIPEYKTCVINGNEYYRTRIKDTDGERVAIYAKTPEELFRKEKAARKQIAKASVDMEDPTVEEYARKWLRMHSHT